MKEIGRYQGVVCCSLYAVVRFFTNLFIKAVLDSLEAYTLALFTRVLGWHLDHVHIFLAKVRAEIKDPRHHLYLFVYVVYGRKPL